MKLHQIIKEKRLERGLTRAYLADYMGVSVQAVSKWERGATSPDIFLLPLLARVLKIDMNHLFNFDQSLTDAEVYFFTDELTKSMQNPADFETVFSLGMAKLQEFPNSEFLALEVIQCFEDLQTAFHLEKEPKYEDAINQLYLRLMDSDDPTIQYTASWQYAWRLIDKEAYDEAEMVAIKLPERPMDRRDTLAEIYTHQKRYPEAQALYEDKLLNMLGDFHNVLSGLALTSAHQNNPDLADYYATIYRNVFEALGVSDFMLDSILIAVDIAKKDMTSSLKALQDFRQKLDNPIDSETPIQKIWDKRGTTLVNQVLYREFLDWLEHKEATAFLREHPDFEPLLASLRERERTWIKPLVSKS